MFDVIEHTREDWRDLGFYYDFDKVERRWRLIGTRSGLSNLAELIRTFANKCRARSVGEHEHLGPYSYFTLVLADAPAITDYGVFGRSDDLLQLATVLDDRVFANGPGQTIVIDAEYSNENEAVLELVIKEDGFDPSSADSFEWAKK